MLATSKMIKEGDRERFVAPDVNFLVVPTLAAGSFHAHRDITVQQIHSLQ